MSSDNLSVPLLKMARFFLNPPPPVEGVAALRAKANAIRAKGVMPTEGEVRLLTLVESRMLEVEKDPDNKLLQKSLASLASLVLAVIEDHEFAIPADRHVGGRSSLDALAVQLTWEIKKRTKLIKGALEAHKLKIARSLDVEALQESVADPDPRLAEALSRSLGHLRQGELLLTGKRDPAGIARHKARLAAACQRTTLLLARLLAVPAAEDSANERRILVQHEMKLIEIDALGIEKLSEEAQVKGTLEKLAAHEEDLGSKVERGMTTRIKRKLRDAAAQAAKSEEKSGEDDDAGNWLFNLDDK